MGVTSISPISGIIPYLSPKVINMVWKPSRLPSSQLSSFRHSLWFYITITQLYHPAIYIGDGHCWQDYTTPAATGRPFVQTTPWNMSL
jgi:hypothetical protein